MSFPSEDKIDKDRLLISVFRTIEEGYGKSSLKNGIGGKIAKIVHEEESSRIADPYPEPDSREPK